MVLTLDQICSTCCSTVSEKTFPTYAVQLACVTNQLLLEILSKEEIAGCACYNDDGTTKYAVKIAIRDEHGVFNGEYRYIDSITGADVDADDIIECPGLDCSYFSGV